MVLYNNMENFEDKSNNELLLMIKQYQAEHEALKLTMVKDHDAIVALKERIKRDWLKMEEVETNFNLASQLVLRRLKGDI
jgi:hypothetical protein